MRLLHKFTPVSIYYTLLVFCSILFLNCTRVSDEDIAPKGLADSLNIYIKKVMTRFKIPGLTIAIVKDGNPLYTNAFGVTNVDTKEKMRLENIFHFASVSKPFVATAVMQLVEQGKMNLDDKLISYLPYFRLAGEDYKNITIRQMLNHTSGIPDVRDYEWDKPQFDEGAAERYVRSLKDLQMLFAPGEGARYSNMAFDIMGDVIAKVSRMSFEDYITQNILDPLEMKESSFLIKEISDELRTYPHIWDLKPVVSEVYPYNRPHAPSSTLNSSVIEMMNWAQANLNKGELDGTRILKKESYNVLWDTTVNFTENTKIGLSWFINNYHGLRIISHGGGDLGYRSNITLIPERQLGIILASNYSRTPMSDICDGVLAILFGYAYEIPRLAVSMEIAEVFNSKGIEAAKEYYYKLKSEGEDKYSFNHWDLNRLGYHYLGKNETQKAIEIFEFNVELYPEEANTYDSLGEAYMAAGNIEKAIVNYEKSVELDSGNTNAIKMLKKLKGIK
jgi:CubicO group peptidase (beta-lactamase class C family)